MELLLQSQPRYGLGWVLGLADIEPDGTLRPSGGGIRNYAEWALVWMFSFFVAKLTLNQVGKNPTWE
jgi:hypothetical protein